MSKRACTFLFLLLFAVVLVGCGASEGTDTRVVENDAQNGDSDVDGETNGKLSGEVVVAAYGGTYDEIFMEYVVKPFEELHPNVTVTLAPYMGLARLQTQGGGGDVDVVSLDDFDLIAAANEGLLLPLEAEDFTHWHDLYPEAFLKGKDGNVYGLANVFGSWGIAYNPEKVDKPRSWNDFFSPDVEGRIALMEQWIPDILMLAEARGADLDNMEPVWEAYSELTPAVAQYYSSFSAPESLFQTGEVWMASWFDGRAYNLQNQGASIDFAIPEEGGILIRSGMGVTADSDQPELAKALIDFAMSGEPQIAYAIEMFYSPTNSTIVLPEEWQEYVVYGSEQVQNLITPDWNEILSHREEWLMKWQEATRK